MSRLVEGSKLNRAETDLWVPGASVLAAQAKDGGVAQGDGEHRRIPIGLVHVLVRPHLGALAIEVDQARVGRDGRAGEPVPEGQELLRHRWPGFIRERMAIFIAIAGPVADPAITADAGLGHGHGFAARSLLVVKGRALGRRQGQRNKP